MSVDTVKLITPSAPPTPETDDRNYRRLGWIVLGLLIGVFGIWGSLAPLSSAVPAPGKVIVASNNRVVQHLEGGIVKTIKVRDGDIVKAGEVLIELDTTQSKAQLEIAQGKFFENLALESRLIAERDGMGTIIFSDELTQMEESIAKSTLIDGQRREFQVRAQDLSDQKTVLLQRIEQLKNQIQGLEAIISSKNALSNSYSEEIKEWEILYKEQLIDKIKLRDIKREKVRIEGEIANAKAEISRARAQIAEMNAQIISQKQSFATQVAGELRQVQMELSDLRSRIGALKDTLTRTTIVSPVGGTVTNLKIHTIGGVIPSGQPILEIVPSGEPLIIEGKVAANEVTNVRVGLETEIRFPNFAHVKDLNVVQGEVIFVAPDAIADEQTHNLYYPVKIQITPKGVEELQKNRLSIQAGMPADAMIVVGTRTFMDYMITPLSQMVTKAFNEE